MTGKNDNRSHIPGILIAAPRSGSGKTLFTCALLKLFKDMGREPVSFKCGPDYIDPLFHERVQGVTASNLDTYFMDENRLKKSLMQAKGRCAVTEGVMGIYDGVSVESTEGSCYQIAEITDTPVLLIVDAHGAARTLISLVKGILADDEKLLIRGLVLNRISPAFYAKLEPVLKKELSRDYPQVKFLGGIPNDNALKIGSRHLGLDISTPREEVLAGIARMAELIEQNIDIKCLSDIMETAADIEAEVPERDICTDPDEHPVLAVAMDEAFCFYYKDNFELLKEMGVEIRFFSPIHDKALPEDTAGILLGGGYPEMYLKELSENTEMIKAVGDAIGSGIPSLAECGGFMYLHKYITDTEGKRYTMAGVIDGECTYTGKSVRFGYLQIVSAQDADGTLAVELPGMKGHEFHYYDSTLNGDMCTASKPSGTPQWSCMTGNKVSLWGFPHFYYPSAPGMVRKFAECMKEYRILQCKTEGTEMADADEKITQEKTDPSDTEELKETKADAGNKPDLSSTLMVYAGPEFIDRMQMQAAYAGPAQMNPALQTPAEGVYAGPTMLMAYAGPAMQQPTMMQQMMMVYAGPSAGPSASNTPMMNLPGAMMGPGKGTARVGKYCFCPECGSMSKGEWFCRECGTPLKGVKHYKDCPGCNARLDAEAKFCQECGKKQDDTPQTNGTQLA